MKKIFLLFFVPIIIFALTACDGENENNQTTGQIEAAVVEQIQEQTPTSSITELTVWGMTCNRCVNKISSALSGVDGIKNVSVDLNAELVTVEHDFNVDAETIAQTITREGFNIP